MTVKLLLQVIAVLLAVIGVILLINLKKYIKRYANECVEAHEAYIKSRFMTMSILSIVAGVLNLIAMFL